MNKDQFLEEIEGYYGVRYSKGQRKYVKAWLGKRQDSILPLLLGEVFKSFSASFRSVPAIKELEDALKEVKGYKLHEALKGDQLLITEEEDIPPEQVKKNFALLREIFSKLESKRITT